MASVTLVGVVPSLADVVAAALAGEGHTVIQLPLNADVLRELAKRRPDAVVFDGHAYANTKAFLADLRARPETHGLPVVLIGPERPAEAPQFEVVHQVGRTLDLNALIAAIRRAVGQVGD